MAQRKPYHGYGSVKPQIGAPMRAPLPPPPDGKPPVRLPIGEEPNDAEPDMDADDPVAALMKKFRLGANGEA